MRMIVVAAAVALLAPAAALADPAPQVDSAGARPGEPLICHYYYHEGQIVRRPICKTERAWIRERLRTQADVSDWQIRSLIQHP